MDGLRFFHKASDSYRTKVLDCGSAVCWRAADHRIGMSETVYAAHYYVHHYVRTPKFVERGKIQQISKQVLHQEDDNLKMRRI